MANNRITSNVCPCESWKHNRRTRARAHNPCHLPRLAPLQAKFLSAPAAAWCTPAEGDPSSGTSGLMAPAAAIATLFSSAPPREEHDVPQFTYHTVANNRITSNVCPCESGKHHRRSRARAHEPCRPPRLVPLTAKFQSALAATSCTPVDGDPSSATSGLIAPAAAIATWFSAAPPREKTRRSALDISHGGQQ